MFYNEWGDEFSTWEEAVQGTIEKRMTKDDLLSEIVYHLTYEELIQWAMKQPNFDAVFHDKIKMAQKNWVYWLITEERITEGD